MPEYLLDKNIVRKTIEGLVYLQDGETMPPDRAACLPLLHAAVQKRCTVYITPQSLHVLQHKSGQPEVRQFLEAVHVLQLGRYTRRWARRLRDHGFTGEDAVVLSLGTFGTDANGTFLGVDALITMDIRLVNNFNSEQADLSGRLSAMTRQLLPPYRYAKLPQVWNVFQALAALG